MSDLVLLLTLYRGQRSLGKLLRPFDLLKSLSVSSALSTVDWRYYSPFSGDAVFWRFL
jgi:hypothetical protein